MAPTRRFPRMRIQFTNDTTANPKQAGTPDLRSPRTLGLQAKPTYSPFSSLNGQGSVWAGFAQDKWKLNNNVTLTFWSAV